MTATSRVLVVAALLFGAAAPVLAQQISIDRGVRAAGLWCFPLAADCRTYVCLPNQVRLANDDACRPHFSFVRYTVEKKLEAETPSSINAAGGGGVLHFLIEMDTAVAAVSEAQQVLRR